MQSVFEKINEQSGDWWQTRPLKEMPGSRQAVVTVAAVVETHYIHKDAWKPLMPHDGSVTFQHKEDNHSVITIFVDKDNKLAQKEGLSLQPDPIVVAIELTTYDPFVRSGIREKLERMFHYYLNPEKPGRTKYRLKPNEDHFFDILFLEPGECPEVDDDTLVRIDEALDAVFSEG